ncbi:hypothetical protein [Mycobacterium paragordonae]|uniref:hypothetical protein n=1 Tax=Mycobacterium paragordonae TaxID=1389713 RepID=UPI0013C4BE5C|nr:hypothetical protein [Mycobacterium paragordonae]
MQHPVVLPVSAGGEGGAVARVLGLAFGVPTGDGPGQEEEADECRRAQNPLDELDDEADDQQ